MVAETGIGVVVLVFLGPFPTKIQIALVLLAKLVIVFELEKALLGPRGIGLDHRMVLRDVLVHFVVLLAFRCWHACQQKEAEREDREGASQNLIGLHIYLIYYK